MNFREWKQYATFLTNGETSFEVQGSRYSCGIDPKGHVFGQDGFGNMFIDNKPAWLEIRETSKEDNYAVY